jgi:hypothetical protein
MAGAAAVKIKEIDLSTRVASFAGVYGGVVVPARKGLSSEPVLVSNDGEFLDKFTPDSRVEVGYDLSYYSALAFLERSDKLWVKRVINQAYYAGLSVKSSAGSNNAGLPAGSNLADPDQYVFDSNPDVVAVAHIESLLMVGDSAGSLLDTGVMLYDAAGDSHAFWFDIDNAGGAVPAWALAATNEYRITSVVANDLAGVVASAMQVAIDAVGAFGATVDTATVTVTHTPEGSRTIAVDNGAGATITVDQAGVDSESYVDELLLIHASSEGAWGDKVAIKITTHLDDEDLVPEPESFLLEVYKEGALGTPVEEFFCSVLEGKLDGYGRNMFIEDVLDASNYISAKVNTALSEIYPKTQATAIFLSAGDDGLAITDSEMINALQDFKNPDDIYVNVLMDGGYAVPSYQIAMDNICIQRMDCVAILSTPFSVEDSNNFVSDIVDYRKNQLNLNSSYSALYSTHVLITDRFNDRKIYVSPDGYVAGQISYTASNFEIWNPVGGFRRGVLNVEDVRRRFESGHMDSLYNVGVNPIRFAPGRGITIWGQKTLLSRPSSLDRLNVRLLLIVIEPAIKEFLEDFLFELNTRETRAQVSAKIESYMDGIRARKGVVDYQVICDATNNLATDIDNNRMNVDLFIKPAPSIEEIPFRVVLVSQSTSFSEAAGAI